MEKTKFKINDIGVVRSNRADSFLVTIVRETKTQYITKKGLKFNKKSCKEVGSDIFNSRYLFDITPEEASKIRANVKFKQTVNKIKETIWENYSIDKLEKIAKILEA